MKRAICLTVLILLFNSTLSNAQTPSKRPARLEVGRQQLFPFPNELFIIRSPYEIMKPARFKRIRTAAEEMLKPENNVLKWRGEPIREWACICAGIETLMPGSGPLDPNSLLYAFTLVCAGEYESSKQIALPYLDKPDSAYSANLILGLQTIRYPENVQYLKTAFSLSPVKTFEVLDWFSSNTYEIRDQGRYKTFLRTWIACAAESVKDTKRALAPFDTVRRIELLSMQNKPEIRPFYLKLKSQTDRLERSGRGVTYYYRGGVRVEGPPPNAMPPGQYRQQPQITMSQLQRLKEQVLREKAELEKKIREGSAKQEDLARTQMKLEWIQIREKELSDKEKGNKSGNDL